MEQRTPGRSCPPRRLRRRVAPALAALAALALTACQVEVEVGVAANPDGSGAVEVAVGLDSEAVTRLGDPATALALGDLEGTAWEVSPPAVDDVGVTWVRARRTFEDAAGLTQALDEVAGADGPLAGTSLTVDEAWFTSSAQLQGVVDLSAALAPYTDPELDAATGGVPFGGLVTQVESDLGRPVSEMIDVTVRWSLGTESAVATPALGDAPVVTDLAVEQPNTGRRIGTGVAAGLVVVGGVGALVWWLVRRRRRRRDRSAAGGDPVSEEPGGDTTADTAGDHPTPSSQ